MDKRIITYKLMKMRKMMRISQMKPMKVMKMKRNTWIRLITLSMMILILTWATLRRTTMKLRLSKLKSQKQKTLELALMMKTKMIGKLLDHSKREDSKTGTMMMITHGIKKMLTTGKKLWDSENTTNGARKTTKKEDSERKESTSTKEKKRNSTKRDKIESKSMKKLRLIQPNHYFNKVQLKNNQRWKDKTQRKLKSCHSLLSLQLLQWWLVCNTSQTATLRKWSNSTT